MDSDHEHIIIDHIGPGGPLTPPTEEEIAAEERNA